MILHTPRCSRSGRAALVLVLWAVCGAALPASSVRGAPPETAAARALFQKGDRVAWVGSSSTKIGIWPRTVEFLVRTRHPGLEVKFEKFTTGGGTFATGLEHIDEWLGAFRPTVVVYNYGSNDAGAGWGGLPRFKENMERCVARAQERGARVVLITPQAADVRKSKAEPAAKRTLYAETMLDYGRGRGWTVIDVHHPLDALQRDSERYDSAYTILKDNIHLTNPAYIAWGFFVYDRLDLPFVTSTAVLAADGSVTATENCTVKEVESTSDGLSFRRLDRVLPILPPGPLPPRLAVPLEAYSRYQLAVTGLTPGTYEIRCDGRSLGAVSAGALAIGVNLNSLLLDGKTDAPWADLAKALWDGKELDKVGRTSWQFEVRKK